MQVTLPASLRRYAESRVQDGRYGDVSEFISELVRKDLDEQLRQQRKVLEADLLAAVESLDCGEGRDVTPDYWRELRLRAREELAQVQPALIVEPQG